MAKRTIPLFIFDTTRLHGLGEIDFVQCTDKDNGFIASIKPISPKEKELIGYVNNVNKRIETNDVSNYAALIEIIRLTGTQNTETQRRSLLKLAGKKYVEMAIKDIDIKNPSVQNCIDFLHVLEKGNRHNLFECKINYDERQTIIKSLQMLKAISNYLKLLISK